MVIDYSHTRLNPRFLQTRGQSISSKRSRGTCSPSLSAGGGHPEAEIKPKPVGRRQVCSATCTCWWRRRSTAGRRGRGGRGRHAGRRSPSHPGHPKPVKHRSWSARKARSSGERLWLSPLVRRRRPLMMHIVKGLPSLRLVVRPINMSIYCLLELNMLCLNATRGYGDHSLLTRPKEEVTHGGRGR